MRAIIPVSVSRRAASSARPLAKSREAPGAGGVQAPQDRTSFRGAPGLDVIIVPRREMLDAPFASLEADYARALDRRHRGLCPHRVAAVAAARRSGLLRAISCFFHHYLRAHAGSPVLLRLHGGSRASAWPVARCVARVPASGALPSVWRPRRRSSPAIVVQDMERRVFIAILLSFAVLYSNTQPNQ